MSLCRVPSCRYVTLICITLSCLVSLCHHVLSCHCLLSHCHVSSCCCVVSHHVLLRCISRSVCLHVASQRCVLSSRPLACLVIASRCCIASCCHNVSRTLVLYRCRVLFILLSCYLSQRIDIHPRRTTSTLTLSLLLFCRCSCHSEHAARARRVPKCQVRYFLMLEGGNSSPKESYSGGSNCTLEYVYSYYFDRKFLPHTSELKKNLVG